ncbi:MAG: hypothetical protein COA78_30055 [Blastopirellula sp.]|nr:MAG: hypothetical protein COA78_30055 [Blastopirellula sp.]
MRTSIALLTLAFTCLVFFTADVSAQTPRGSKGKSTLPTDPKLMELHKDFVNKAEKLGNEYASKKDWEKARVVFQEILKLVPEYDSAKEKLVRIREMLSQANRKVVTVAANRDWLDTKIDLEKGSPLGFKTQGEWMFVFEGDADGIEIPRELRDYKLGSLIAMIVTPGEEKAPQPFTVGKEKSMSVPKTGRLYLKMHDGYNKNNRGSIEVEISGNFE